MYHYFKKIQGDDDLSLSALWAIACFLAAVHEVMLASLEEIQKREGSDGKKVLISWHNHMEHEDQRAFREGFFKRVVERADEANLHVPVYLLETYCLLVVTKDSGYPQKPQTRSRWKAGAPRL